MESILNIIDIGFIKDTAKIAGQKIMAVYESEDFKVQWKEDKSPLTLADQVSNDYIVQNLKEKYPDIPIISEEKKNTPYDERKNWPVFWLVDPLDGTKEFLKKNGEFTVNIALVKHDTPILGVVYVPVHDTMYWGLENQGSYKQIGNENQQKLTSCDFSLNQKSLNIVCSRSHLDEKTEAFMKQFMDSQKVSIGSSLKFLLLAEGKAHIYPRFVPTMEWDIAAADIILREAKGKTLDPGTQESIKYNKENLKNAAFVAYANVLG